MTQFIDHLYTLDSRTLATNSFIHSLPYRIASQLTTAWVKVKVKVKLKAEVKIKVKVTLRLAVYRQSVHLGFKSLESQDQRFIFN
jgi:16S rRNA A1518/A1519 N6-dimethyltransferase RsmA/KsgA/DIM1 with predicted DNA glycosylase/AP lyase activity